MLEIEPVTPEPQAWRSFAELIKLWGGDLSKDLEEIIK